MANKRIHLQQSGQDEILYHYTKSGGVTGILDKNCFWATKNDFLNDPNEFSYIRDIIIEVCVECIADEKARELFLHDVLNESVLMAGKRNREYFVLSFSKSRDSITLWSEFGSQTGYNIGLKSEEIIDRIAEENTIEYHGYVVYDKKQQLSYIREILTDAIHETIGMSLGEILKLGRHNHRNELYRKACHKFQKMAGVYAMFFKNEAFLEEQEYRFVFKRQKNTKIQFREKDGFLIPYIEIGMSEDPLPVTDIMVAPKNHMDLARSGMEYLLAYKGYHAPVNLSDIKLRY